MSPSPSASCTSASSSPCLVQHLVTLAPSISPTLETQYLTSRDSISHLQPTVVQVISSSTSSSIPDIIIEDYTPPSPSSSSLSLSDSSGSVYYCRSSTNSNASANHDDRDLLQVPPMSWITPRELLDDPPPSPSVSALLGSSDIAADCSKRQDRIKPPTDTILPPRATPAVKKKKSIKRLVAGVLGEISNVARRRPELPPSASSHGVESREPGCAKTHAPGENCQTRSRHGPSSGCTGLLENKPKMRSDAKRGKENLKENSSSTHGASVLNVVRLKPSSPSKKNAMSDISGRLKENVS